MPSIKFDTIIETAKVVSGFRDIQNAVRQTSERVEKEGKSIDDVINKIQNSFNIAIGGWSIGKFVNQMMQVRGQFQQTEMAFKTMLQSEEKANELMKQMIHTAAITPFGVEDVTEGAKQLLAFNVAAEDVNKTLIGLGDVAAGMGMNLSDMVMLYGTTIAKGKMDTMDLYQFLNRGIPIADELAKVMGLDLNNAIGEVQKQIKAGKVTSEIFIQAMQNMTAEGSKFGGLMEAQSKTITGQISNIEDAIEQMFNELGKSQEGVINTGLDIVSKLVDNWETVGKVLMTVVATYGAYKAAVIAMIAIEKARIALNAAQTFISLARSITSAKDAMALFNTVCSANTLGMVLGLVAAGYTAFKLFGNHAKSASEMTQDFGDEANKASRKVQSLVSTIQAMDAGNSKTSKSSKVYKDTVKDLVDVYDSYGIKLTKIKDDESNLVAVKDEAIRKSQELVEQIKLESIERNRANAISRANEKYNNSVKEAMDDLYDNLEGDASGKGSGVALYIQNLVTDDTVRKFNRLNQEMQGLSSSSNEYKEKLGETKDMVKLLNDSVTEYAKKNDVSQSAAREALQKYFKALTEGRVELDRYTKTANDAADASEKEAYKTASFGDKLIIVQKQLQNTSDDVHTLHSRIEKLMHEYGDNGIKFHLDFDAKVPDWMTKMDVPELGRLGKKFAALAKTLADSGKKGAKVNGKWWSIDEIAQRGYDYSRAANDKQTANEEQAKKDAKAKAEAEEEAKKKAKNAKKAANDAKKKAEDQKKAQEQLNEDLKQLEQQNQDTIISLMQEGTEKKLKEIDNDYKKRLAEIDKQEAEFKKKNKEAGKSPTLTKGQSSALNEAREIADKQMKQSTAELYQSETEALQSFLKDYGTFKEKQLAIAKDYDKKIAAAEKDGKIFEAANLRAQKQKDIGTNKANMLESQIDYSTVFGNFGIVLRTQLQDTLKTMSAFTKTKEFKSKPIDEQKAFFDKMNELESKYGTSTFSVKDFKKVGDLIDIYNKKLKDRNEAEEKLNGSSAELLKANEEYQKALKNGTKEEKEKAKAKLDKTISENEQDRANLNEANSQLADAQNNVTTSANKLTNSLQAIDGMLNSMASGSLSSVWRALTDFDEKVNGGKLTKEVTKSIGKVLGKAFEGKSDLISMIIGAILNILDVIKEQGIGGLVGGLVDTILGAIDGFFKNILSGKFIEQIVGSIINGIGNIIDTVIGAIGSVVSFGALSSKGPSSWFENSNAQEVEDAINNLTESNERLQKSIDKLKDTMKDSYGKESTNAYKEALRQQKTYNQNTLQKAKEQAGYHGSHHSWNYYWGGFNQSQLASIRRNVKSDFNGDIWSLTPEEMKKLLSYQDFVNAIKDNGKGGYGDAVLEKLEEYADLAGNLDELTEEWRESITQISFDSMKDNFISNLMDMSKSASDFADDFAEMMQKALLAYSMEDLINGDLKKLYEDWAKLMDTKNGAFTQSDVANFQERYDKIVQEGLKRRDEWAKVTGYTGDSSSSQSATSGGWQSVGQDSIDELNGRFTALQIAGEAIAKDMVTNVAQMETIVNLGISTNGAVIEIRNMMIMTNSYLEDVVKYAKLSYTEFGSKMDDMVKSLKKI